MDYEKKKVLFADLDGTLIETYSEHAEIICPYCGYIHDRHDFELPDKMEFDHVLCKCGNCDSKFYLGQTVTVYNETYKVSRNDRQTKASN